jgi:type VI secretion system secreted protein Hcp
LSASIAKTMSAPGSSSDIFLKVQTKRAGQVKGEVASPGHENEIEVASWYWSVQASSAIGSNAATARRSYSGLTVIKRIDSASTALLSALATNDEVKEACLTMRRSGGDAVDFFLMTLREARVTQVEHSVGDDGGTRETVTFTFRKVEVEYRRQEGTGTRGASSVFTDEVIPSG